MVFNILVLIKLISLLGKNPAEDTADSSCVARGEVYVSMSSFCCSSHKQIEASTHLGAMSAHETAKLLHKGVEFNTLISRLGDTVRGSPRWLHRHLFWEASSLANLKLCACEHFFF